MTFQDPTAPLSLALRLGVLELINKSVALVLRDLTNNETLHPHAYQVLKDFLPRETYRTFLQGKPDESARSYLQASRSQLFDSLRTSGLSIEDCSRLSELIASDQLTALVEKARRHAAESARLPSPTPPVLEHRSDAQLLEDAMR